MIIPSEKGSYIIVYRLYQQASIKVGRLGNCVFHTGFYFYCGSAFGSGGLASRVNRHINKSNKLFWHIDYFKQIAEPHRVWFTTSSSFDECSLVRLLIEDNLTEDPQIGFGASDCKEKCVSHLLHLCENRDLNTIFLALKQHIPDIKEEKIVKKKLLR